MAYVKGYKIDRAKVASMIQVDPTNPQVDDYVRVIVHMIPRTAYKYIVAAKERDIPVNQVDGHLALVIALAAGDDENAVKDTVLTVDDAIKWAKPHVLVGPEVWETVL